MTQLQLTLPDDVAARIQKKAERLGLSISELVTELATREDEEAWPERFFEEVVGGWQGEPLRRFPEGRIESRDEL